MRTRIGIEGTITLLGWESDDDSFNTQLFNDGSDDQAAPDKETRWISLQTGHFGWKGWNNQGGSLPLKSLLPDGQVRSQEELHGRRTRRPESPHRPRAKYWGRAQGGTSGHITGTPKTRGKM